MKAYKKMIIEATNCKETEAVEVEEIMREDLLHSTLDWLTKKQFNVTAKAAYRMYQYMNTPEGIDQIKQLKSEM